MVLLTQLPSTVTPEVISSALAQFGTVSRVVVRKDPLCPAANLFTHAASSALVEMASAQVAQQVGC